MLRSIMTEIYNPKTWHELSYRDKSAYTTANVSFFLGWLIAFVGLFLPPIGEVSPSVITVFGIGISFTGGVYGIALYIKGSKTEILNEVNKHMEELFKNKEEQDNGE